MPKINHEEYEVLKGLDDRWKWIARDENGKLYIYDKKPKKIAVEWVAGRGSYLSLGNEKLQFIQWEDEEAHNIAELVGEYKSEDKEVKKQELIKNIKSLARETSQQWPHEEMVELTDVLREINQLDESEVLSQEWISENVEYAYFDMLDGSGRLSSATAIITPEKLQNLLVPKQELPVVPELVADHIQSSKDMGLTLFSAMENVNEDYENKVNNWLWDGSGDDSFQVFAKAWLAYPNIEVEKEQKYIIKIAERDFMVMDDDGVMYPVDINIHKYKYQFTEQEIRDYDERYIPFMVPVDEVNND